MIRKPLFPEEGSYRVREGIETMGRVAFLSQAQATPGLLSGLLHTIDWTRHGRPICLPAPVPLDLSAG